MPKTEFSLKLYILCVLYNVRICVYSFNDDIHVRCAFIDLGDGTSFVGALSEYSSLNNGGSVPLQQCGLIDDCAYNENDLENGEERMIYRWSHERMTEYRSAAISQSMDGQSYLLMSCNRDLSFTLDYAFLPFDNAFLTSEFSGQCFNVKGVNIRGYDCQETDTYFWSLSNACHVHIGSSHSCSCSCCPWTVGAVLSEDNFGCYFSELVNPLFSGTLSPLSTTELVLFYIRLSLHSTVLKNMCFFDSEIGLVAL